MVDTAEALAHKMAAQNLASEVGGISPASWRGLDFRRHLDDPFDLRRCAIVSSTDTLFIRNDADDATFVLHNRSAGNVAVVGGMLQILGNAEHGRDGSPADYIAELLVSIDVAHAAGRVRVCCLGVALEASTLYGELLTVGVFDGDLRAAGRRHGRPQA